MWLQRAATEFDWDLTLADAETVYADASLILAASWRARVWQCFRAAWCCTRCVRNRLEIDDLSARSTLQAPE